MTPAVCPGGRCLTETPDGAVCRFCRKTLSKQARWVAAHRERYNAYQRAYRAANREGINRKRRLMRAAGMNA